MYQHRKLFCLRNPFFDSNSKPNKFTDIPILFSMCLTWGDKGMLGDKRLDAHWLLEFNFGRGAGYILGRTLFFARNMRNRFRDGAHSRKRYPLQLGFTQNWNKVPCSDGT